MRAYIAELVGTFILVFGGCGAAVLAGAQIGYLGVSFAFGLSLLAMIYTVGPISGCHLNPAVTVGLLVSRKIYASSAMGYIIAQVVGAIAAAAVLLVIAKGGSAAFDPSVTGFASNGYGARSPGGYGIAAGFVTEVVLTAVLVLTILGATDVKAPVGFAGLAIGLVLTLIHLVGIPITNTSVNPARSVGPALFAGGAALSQLWLFIVAPIFGGLLAAGIFAVIREPAEMITARRAEQALPQEQRDRIAATTDRPAA